MAWDLRILNVLIDNPSIHQLMDEIESKGFQEVANRVYHYPPHIAAKLALALHDNLGMESECNQFINALDDCFLAERDKNNQWTIESFVK
jgi:hypothetical protein